MFACLIFMVTLFSVESSQEVTFSTQSTAVLIGHNITLECGKDKQDTASWTFESPGGESGPTVLFATQDENDGRFLLTNETGSYDLVIRSARQSHAGVYTCALQKGDLPYDQKAIEILTSRIELIVIISGPECHTNGSTTLLKESDYITMECFLQFRGNVVPVMKWSNEMSKQIIASQTNEKLNQHVRSNVILNTDEINDGDSISCTIYFNQSSHLDEDNFTSAPQFEYVWTSLPIRVAGRFSSVTPTAQFTELKNGASQAATLTDKRFDWSQLLIAFCIIVAILTIITISIMVRKRGRIPKDKDDSEQMYCEDPGGGSGVESTQTTSGVLWESRWTEVIADSPLYTVTQSLENAESSKRNVDSDRIIYTEAMELERRGSERGERDQTHPLFNKSIYAAIDHTVQVISHPRLT